MPQAVDSIASALQELSAQLSDLEKRVAALEARPAVQTVSPSTSSVLPSGATVARGEAVAEPSNPYPRATESPAPRPATFGGVPPAELPTGAIPVLGRAVLGIAGAYLLRAIAESSSVPKLAVLVVAILYAGFWIAWAVRIYAANRFAGTTYAITSALILSPLLWESAVRFQTLSPTFTACVLAAYVIFGIAMAWRGDLQLIPWVVVLASVMAAIALIIGTHALVPLTAALLAIALATETAVSFRHRLSVRAIPAIAADFSVLLTVSILTADTIPEDYRPATPATIVILCFALLAIYAGSIAVNNFARWQRITVFETAQAALAFGLASFGALRATHEAIAPSLGLMFLIMAAICEWGALSRFAEDSQTRNRRVSATWAAALLVAGSFLLFSPRSQTILLCVAAIAAVLGYVRTRRFSLALHASFYLAAAAAVSPLPTYAGSALGGTIPGAPDTRVLLVVVTAALCYAIGSRISEAQPKRHLVWTIPAAIVGFACAAVVVVAIVSLAGAPSLSRFLRQGGDVEFASKLSVIRTVVNCALALALGFFGSRWQRIEFRWVAYAAVAFGTLKLLFEDLRFGNASTLVVSLVFYGLVLILLPRLTRRDESEKAVD